MTEVLALATEADHYGEKEEPGSDAFFELAAELHGALFRATANYLPVGVLEMLTDQADPIAQGKIADRSTDLGG